MENSVINNSFNLVEYGTESLKNTQISINPAISDIYEESTTSCIEDVYTRKKMESEILEMYEASDFYKKYGNEYKKIDRCDMSPIYYYFKDAFMKIGTYNSVEIFLCIAEFFDMNYKILYNDIISLEDKGNILTTLDETIGLENIFEKSYKLF